MWPLLESMWSLLKALWAFLAGLLLSCFRSTGHTKKRPTRPSRRPYNPNYPFRTEFSLPRPPTIDVIIYCPGPPPPIPVVPPRPISSNVSFTWPELPRTRPASQEHSTDTTLGASIDQALALQPSSPPPYQQHLQDTGDGASIDQALTPVLSNEDLVRKYSHVAVRHASTPPSPEILADEPQDLVPDDAVLDAAPGAAPSAASDAAPLSRPGSPLVPSSVEANFGRRGA